MTHKQSMPLPWLGWIKKIRSASKAPVVQKIGAPLGVVRRMVRPPMMTLARLTGVEKQSQQKLTLNCGLDKQNYHVWMNLLFGDTAVTKATSLRFTVKSIVRKKPAADAGAELTVVPLKYSDFSAYSDGRWFFIPEWVSGVIGLPLPKECLSQERVKSDIRRISSVGFAYDISRDPQVFDEFYHTMYLPYIDKRHGEAAMYDSFAEKRKFSEQFDLLLVKKIDNPQLYIAGVMLIYEPEGPRFWSLGVREGGNYVQEGVIGALYHFSFRYLLEKGFDHVRTGGSRAFLHDGVFKFKRKMSQAIIGSNWKGYALGVHTFTPAVKAFLISNPFIFKQHDGLSGAIFVETINAVTEKQIRRLHKDYAQPGLSLLVVYYFTAAENQAELLIPDDLCGQLVFYPAETILLR